MAVSWPYRGRIGVSRLYLMYPYASTRLGFKQVTYDRDRSLFLCRQSTQVVAQLLRSCIVPQVLMLIFSLLYLRALQ